jgi:CelD/BcsL family acetyltransferase involved in cellulose biosynthesis
MTRGIRAARVALFVMAGLMVGTGVTAAQADLAKALVGTWKGELQQRTNKGADPTVVLIIKSLKQEDGKWVASARVGPTEEKTGAVQLEIDTSGAKPVLRWTGGQGAIYNLTLLDEKNLTGTATLTTGQGGARGDRDRQVKLEKKE